MGKTLFWYLFKDLLRVFCLAAFVLAGIMSFGGLLKPLTKHGLDAWQVAQMWLYLMPAMMTYSLPVAAVFAASVIYGRFSADNELTASRAAGISYSAVLGPALSLGVVSALVSLLFLSYVVPFFSYQVERVIYANVARVIAAEIRQTHAFRMSGGQTIFAREAYIPPDSETNGEQTLVLVQPTLMSSTSVEGDPELRVPKIISVARKATLHIQQDQNNDVQVWAVLDGPTTFTRELGTGPEGGTEASSFGPVHMPSPLQQNVKFMNIERLRQLASEPERLSRVREQLGNYITVEQRQIIFNRIVRAIRTRPDRGYRIASAEPCVISAMGAEFSYVRDEKHGWTLVLTRGPHPITVTRQGRNGRNTVYECGALRIWLEMDPEYRLITYNLEMQDALATVDDVVRHFESRSESFTESMPSDIQAIYSRKVSDYLGPNPPTKMDLTPLLRERLIAFNDITAELHSRASFAISCLVLVMVGSLLGMLFRSGDFLTAFAVSVLPAILTITLVVAGLQLARHVSRETLSDPIVVAVCLIWLGNGIAAMLAATLFWRIHRT